MVVQWADLMVGHPQCGAERVLPGRLQYVGDEDAFGPHGIPGLDPGAFETAAVFSVQNPGMMLGLAGRHQTIKERYGISAEVVPNFWHATRIDADISNLLDFGFSMTKATDGSFGRGFYVTNMPLKANSYQHHWLGNTTGLRLMLRCSVLYHDELCEVFRVGHFDRMRRGPTAGYTCVSGFLQTGHELVFYDPRDIVIDAVVVYKVRDVRVDKPAQLNIVTKPCIMMTDSLSKFLHGLEDKFVKGDPARKTQHNMLVRALLYRETTAIQFIADYSVFAGMSIVSAVGTAERLVDEVGKCRQSDAGMYVCACVSRC